MGKMSKFMRLLACLFTFVFIGSAYGAGYTCNNNKKYTACADGYYPSQCGSKRDGSTVAAVVGGSCLACPSGHTCSGSNLTCPRATNISVTCSAGKYIKSGTTTCSQSCPAGKYCTAGTFTIPATGAKSDTGNIYNCPSGYTSDAGAQANTWCYVKCAPGTRVVKAGGTCTTPAGPWYMWATTVFYGNVSHVVHCMNGFTNTSTSAANHTGMGNCTRSVSAGQYIASGFQQARYIRVSTSGNSVNSAGLHVAEIQAYSDRFGNGTNYLAGVKTGTGTNLGNATDGNWKRIPYAEGGSTLTWDMGAIKEIGSIKLALYADGRTYRAVTVSVSTNNSTWTTVMAPVDIVTSVRAGANETVDPEWIILSGNPVPCSDGTYYGSARTANLQSPTSVCTSCPKPASVPSVGTWGKPAWNSSAADSAEGAGSINSCLGKDMPFSNINGGSGTRRCFYTSGSGTSAVYNTGCNYEKYTSCNAGYQMTMNGSYNGTAQVNNRCTACSAGSYKSVSGTGACTACAIGSYSAAGASRCTACSGGKTTTATGQSSCNATCTNATGASTWTSASWAANSVTNKCAISTCLPGYVRGGTANSTGASSYTCSVGTYTITLNNNGGSGGAGSVKEVYKTKWTNSAGTTITSVAIPTRSGYVFNGYYTEASGGTRYITNTGALPANTTFVASRTLYAQWTAATCSKGTGVSIATASVSSNRVSCSVTCSTGYSQSGGTNTTTSFTVTGAAGVATVATACKIRTATCSAGYHLAAGTVACSACPAGKYCAGSSTAFSYNASAAQGITGACASGGWSAGGASNSACTTCLTSGNCGACPTGYSYNSATGKTARNQCRIQCAAGTRVASANATCTTPNNSGYTWGWYISQHVVNAGSLSSGISTCSAGYTTPNTTTQTDHDSSADCKAISYTITYNQNSGTGCANSTYTVAAAKTLCTPSRTGYTFGGWFTNSGLTGSSVSSIAAGTTGNKEYWAKWTANSFTVVYDLNNGTGTKPGNKACTYNAACALDAGTGTSYYRAGYVLKGWSTNKAATSGSFDGKNLATSGTVTVYAIWAGCAAGTAKAAGVAAATACSTCAAGTYTSVAGQASCAACPAGYYCTGGTNVTNCGDGKYRSATGGKVASDCSLCSALTGVSVSGGTYSSAAAATSNTQCKYTAPTPAKPANCATITVNQVTYSGSAWPASTYNVTANAGYHTANSPSAAPTCPANTYTVTYNKNDTAATGTMANSSHTYGVAKALTANGFTNGTKKFLGWATSANGAVAYTNSQSVSNLTTSNGRPVTLYAKWGDCTPCAASSGATCSLSAPLGVCTYATNCSAGYTSIVNSGKYNPSCSACAAGTYKGAAGTGACTGCPAGSFCVQGATAPTSCATLGGGLYRSSAANSKANTACYITTTAGKYVANNTDTAQTTCPNGKYCTAKTLYWPNAGGTETCPAADAAHARTTYPDTYYPYKSEAADDIDKSGTLAREGIFAQTWGTGWAGIENCLVVYRIKNAAATFQVEGVAYNATSGKYDRGGSMYYNTVVAGYYLDTICSETYCNTKSNPMLYRRAIACPAGSYCPGGNVPLCSSGTYNSSWGRYACPSGYPNSAAKAGAITSCFSRTKSRPWSGKPTACDMPDGCATVECNDCSVGACNYVAYSNAAGNGDGDIKSGCATNNAACLQTVKSVTASPGYYISGLTCPACGGNAYYCPGGTTARQNVTAGYYSTGGTATTRTGQTKCTGWNYCDAGVKKDCPAAEKDWSLVSWEGMEGITACSQLRNATSVSSYCSAGQLKKNATSSGTWPAAATISVAFQAKAGSIVSGQTCTQCSGAVWSAGGTATACNACPANYGANTATGKTAASQCQTSCAAGYAVQEANKACAIVPSGYQTGTHKVNYGSTTPKAADSTSPAAGTWYSCLTNYSATGSAATNHDARSDCKINCGAGTRIASANATSCTTPSGNWWIGAHTVAAGSASSVSNCNSGYSISGTAATDHDAAADCKISCGGGYYIPTAGGGCKACPAGKYCTGGAKAQTETLAVTGNCPAGTYSTGGATSSACTAALSGYTAAVCATDKWSAAGASECTACTTANGYHNSGTTAAAHANRTSCVVSCGNSTYVASAGAACTSVGTGYWRAAHTVAEGNSDTRSQCPAGYRNGAATNAESNCIMNVAGGKYVKVAKESAASGTCSPGYAKAAHNVNYGSTSSCAACTGATYAASAGQASCTQCPTATNSTDVTGYAYWNGGVANDHTVREGCYAIFKGKTVPNGTMSAYKCYIDKDTNNYGIAATGKTCWVEAADLKCNGGYYNVAANGGATQPGGTTLENLWNTACVNVGAGYWSAANALTRTACASGLTTIGYGAGADEAGDCGRVMRFGDSKLYLRSTKKTTPSLNVKIGDKTFYGNMSTSTKGRLRIKKDATTYSVHDDSM